MGETSRDELSAVFSKYVDHKDGKGQTYITGPGFIKNFVGVDIEQGAKDEIMALLTGIVDTTQDGLISFEEFCAFEKFLTAPDVSYRMVFRLFDQTRSGFVTFAEFKNVYSKTVAFSTVPFEFNCEFVHRHFGEKKTRELPYSDFVQMLNGLQLEHLKQAFEKRDNSKDGMIFPLDVQEVMASLRSNSMTPFISENLVALAKGNKISYSSFLALNKILSNIEMFSNLYDQTLIAKSAEKRKVEDYVLKDEFMTTALEHADVTPEEVELLFQIVAFEHEEGHLTKSDFDKLTPLRVQLAVPINVEQNIPAPEKDGALLSIAKRMFNFGLGCVAGCTGATAVYPIDLVKTRLQNQRKSAVVGEVMYRNFWDCFKKVIRFEGYLGLYRGLPPQLVGVAPEKSIKLTMNDLVRDMVKRNDNSIPLWGEILAGGTAGGCQVIFTNPLEIVKIRLQVAGEVKSATKINAISVMRELGITGLYKGSRACFLRDIPFSAIYFPLYANLKLAFQDESGQTSMGNLFIAGVLAGVPAPFLTTPADVIKTRLQVKAREGQQVYSGVVDCARKLMREEGWRVFWVGANQRVFRSAPQFGVTLLTYEFLKKALPWGTKDAQPHRIADAKSSKHIMQPVNPDHIGGLRTASLAFAGIESKFGLFLPKFKHPVNQHIYQIKKT